MKSLLAGVVLAASFVAAAPAFAQRIDIGPGGPSVDLRSRGQRERDFQREEYRRDREYDADRMYRRQRYDDDRPMGRRGYGY